MMKEKFVMTDEDFDHYSGDIGMDKVKLDAPCNLAREHIEAFEGIVGKDNVTAEDYPRLAVAYGKTGYDAARLRERRIDSLPDLVIYPSSTEEVEDIVAYCAEKKDTSLCIWRREQRDHGRRTGQGAEFPWTCEKGSTKY